MISSEERTTVASYDPSTMPGGFEQEIRRLEAQMAVMWPAERRQLAEWGVDTATHIADVGCGSGALLARLAAFAPDATITGVDHDPRLLAVAAERCATVQQPERIRLRESSADALPFDDGELDVAILRFVVQHLPDPVRTLEEVRRVLRPGGRVVVFDVDGGLWGIAEPRDPVLAELQQRGWTRDESGRRDEGRPDRFVGRRLNRYFTSAGFEAASTRVYSYDSDELGIDAFRPLLDPVQLMHLVEQGVMTPMEMADAIRRFRAWCARPDAYALLVGFAASATKPA